MLFRILNYSDFKVIQSSVYEVGEANYVTDL